MIVLLICLLKLLLSTFEDLIDVKDRREAREIHIGRSQTNFVTRGPLPLYGLYD